VQLLLDENISPSLVQQLAEMGVYAQSVPHLGLRGRSDLEIWQFASRNGFAVVTYNARDFLKLLNEEIHPGLILLRENDLSREEQWRRLKPLIEHILASGDEDLLVNRIVEIIAPGRFKIRSLPE
jgi:predicted nuclease of predicted toxin-antitoxin system